jgi:protein arginine kinase
VTIEELFKSEGIWNAAGERDADIVLKSSSRFFRNLQGHPFHHRLSRKEREEVTGGLLSEIQEGEYATSYRPSGCTPMERHILTERNILQDDTAEDSVVVLSQNENSYFVLGSYDHLTLVSSRSGFQFDDHGREVLNDLERRLGFEFLPDIGYLTSRPEHAGGGVELSVTLHLAGIVNAGRMNELIIELNRRGLALKSSWIDGYYKVYNRSSRHLLDEDVQEYVLKSFQKIVQKERAVRKGFYLSNRSKIEDKIWRSYGILMSCRLISLFEALELLSHLRFGLSLGIINYISLKDINLLLYFIQDYHLMKRYNLEGEDQNLEEVRAQFLRDYLKEVL